MNGDNVATASVPRRAYTTDGEPATPTACRETYDGGSTYKGRGNCGVPHYVYGETGKVLTKKDVTGEETDERYAAADQFLLEEGARSSFLTILAHDLMEENKIEMPMNMPFTTLPPCDLRVLTCRGAFTPSTPSDELMGGLWSKFEPIPTASRPAQVPSTRSGSRI